ncbi:MAG: hypothetical protein KKE29_19885 [Proteobacteria bacterium]|nr:hypothetical protein [Pseudomonadota bacterium]MBU4574430.1 hypothetical protein [Pseudomonadota bacterium]MBV1715951.1 hypothetical protein [Desulfarculus sp.]
MGILKRLSLGLLIITLCLSVGCAVAMSKKQRLAVDPVTKKVLYDKDGKPIILTDEISAEDSWHNAQVENQKAAKPIAGLFAPDNAPLTLPAGAKFVVYGENGKPKALRQYKHKETQVIEATGNALLKVGPHVVTGMAVKGAMDVAGSQKGDTYNGSFNDNKGNQAARGVTTGAVNEINATAEGASGSVNSNPAKHDTSTAPADGDNTLSFF